MTGLGTLVNVAAVIAGGTVGTFVKKSLPERFKSIIVQAIGLSVLMIGISGVMQGMFRVIDSGKLDRLYIMIMIFSMIIGGITGEIINIEKKLDNLGNWFQKKLSKEGS